MKQTRLPILLAAALCAVPVFAQEPAAGEPAPAAPSVRPPVPPRVNFDNPKFRDLPPAEKEHVRRMAEFRAARDVAERDLVRLRKAVEDRKEAILAENEEAKTLFEDARSLFAEYAAKTNALQAILEKDETISALLGEMEAPRALVKSNQRAINAETVEAMKRRMREQREKAAAEAAGTQSGEETTKPAPAGARADTESEAK